MIIKGKYLLVREFDKEGTKPYFVHYVLLNEDTSPKVARVKQFGSIPLNFKTGSYVRVNSNLLIDKDGHKHVFYTDISEC